LPGAGGAVAGGASGKAGAGGKNQGLSAPSAVGEVQELFGAVGGDQFLSLLCVSGGRAPGI